MQQIPFAFLYKGHPSPQRLNFISFPLQGFGEPSGEHWLGNEFVSKLTNLQSYKLKVELKDWEGNSGFSQYDQFSLETEAQKYR